MPEFIPRLRIFVSSPGDVSDERRITREVIERLPREPLLEGKLAMDAVMWDAPSAPVPLAANETPQASVNRYKGLASDCDLVVVILWRRIGTPLAGEFRKSNGSAYRSGTEFEFEDAVSHGRTCWIYHRTEPFEPTSDDERRQKDAVKDFIDDVRGHPGEPARGGVIDYASSNDFGPLVEKHLEAFVRSWLDGDALGGRSTAEPSPHWLWKSLISVSALGSDSRVTIRGRTGSLVVSREHWPEFIDVQRTYRWFVGRVEMLGRVARFLDRHSSGYFRIVAGAGLGKTALAVELARRYRALAYFVSAPAGRTVPAQVLCALCAQVIVRYELPHRQLPSGAGEAGDALFSLLEEASAKAENHPVVVVIDGLDEVDATPSGHNWLHLPKTLPQNVYVVLIQRPGEFPLVVDPGVAVEAANIEDDPEAQRRDVEAYLWHEVARADVAASLNRAVPPVGPETLVTTLAEASEGNFMYLSYVLGDIASSPEGPNFDGLPSGLEGYYRSVWAQLSEGKKSDRGTWKAVQRPVLALLAAAREPVTAEWLAKHSGADPDDVRELALFPWSRFLARSVRAPQWRVLHKSFSDFLAARSEIDLPRTHARIAEYYSKDLSRAAEDDGYAYRQLSAHLVETGLLDDLGMLIEREDWYHAQRRWDPSGHGYSIDVMRAITMARSHGTPEVGAVAAWSMLYGTVATMASDVPEDALVALVVLGKEELALSHAALKTDAEQRLSAHVRIASSLLDLNKQEAAAGAATLAAAILPEIWPGNRQEWISPIADLLSRAGHVDMARSVLSNGNDESDDAADETATDSASNEEIAKTDMSQEEDNAEAEYFALNAFVRRLAAASERIRNGVASTPVIDDTFQGVSLLSDDIQHRALTAIGTLVDQLTAANDEPGLAHLEEVILGYDGPACASFLGLLAATRALVGDIVRARLLLQEAENRVAASHPDPWIAEEIVGEIAARQVQVEGHSALAGALVRIQNLDEHRYSATLTWITRILQGVGDLQGLRDIFGRADRVAADQRAELFGALAEAFLAAGIDADALAVMQAADSIRAREPRLTAISAVCLSLARAGRTDAALKWISIVIAETQTTQYSSGEIRALCGLASSLEVSGMHQEALDALAHAERASDPARSYGRDTLAISVSQLRNQAEGRAMLDALVSGSAAEEVEFAVGNDGQWHDSGDLLASLAKAMATIGYSDGLAGLRAVALHSLNYFEGKARVLVEIGAAQAKLDRLDDAAAAFGEALTHIPGDSGSEDDDSFGPSTLFSWFDKLVEAVRAKPELLAKLRAQPNVLDRAIAVAKETTDKEWGASVRSGAARLLAHMRNPVAAEELCVAISVHEPDRSAQIRAEQAIVAAADGDGGLASECLRAGRADAERALLDRSDLPESLVALVKACGDVADTNELNELAVVGDRLEGEARVMLLFAMADTRVRLGQFELARSAVETSIRLALAADAKITLTEPVHIAWYLCETMATFAGHSDSSVESWVVDLFTAALRLGRESVLRVVAALAPVLERLGASSPLWQHWQRIDALLVRSPAP